MSPAGTPLADYPGELDEYVTLPSHARLRIRPLRRSEEAAIRALDARLSMRTRYLRFLSPMPALSDPLVRLLACVDYRRRLALVAEATGPAAGDIVALANFGAVDESSAEVALLVRDEWQGQGLGTELAHRLIRAAEARGFHRFIVHVLPENVAIRKILASVGHVVSTRISGGISELAFTARRPPR